MTQSATESVAMTHEAGGQLQVREGGGGGGQCELEGGGGGGSVN